MRTLCDFCESAPAIFFCAADQAALCSSCDDKVHKCNKLASRHVTVKLAGPKAVLRCDICEKAPVFFFCEVDGTSLCLQCDMVVHVGGKRTHGRYLLLRQIIEFPTDKPGEFKDPASEVVVQAQTRMRENQDSHQNQPKLASPPHSYSIEQANTKVIDLNATPHRLSEVHPNHQP